jgi:hypothetical protein
MRMPRVRFTVRRMLVTVAILGVLLGIAAWGAKLHRLSRHYIDVSNYYEQHLDTHQWTAARDPERMRKYDTEMMLKYRALGLTPWLPVEPDPPKPE